MYIKQFGRRKSAIRRFGTHINTVFKIFSAQTSLHGFRFLGDPYRTYGERFFWFLAMGFQIFFCVISINFVLQKWTVDPVILSYDTKPAPVAEVKLILEYIYFLENVRCFIKINVNTVFSFHFHQLQFAAALRFHLNISMYPTF